MHWESCKYTLKIGWEIKAKWRGGYFFYNFLVRVENMLAGEQERCKTQERKERKQIESENNANYIAIEDYENAFDNFKDK